MRVWEQGLVATYSLPGYKELILEHYAAFKRPDTVIEVHGVRDVANAASARIAGSSTTLNRTWRARLLATAVTGSSSRGSITQGVPPDNRHRRPSP